MKKALKIIANKNFFPLLIVILFAILAGRSLIFQSGYFNMHDDLQIMRQLEMEKCFLDGQIPCRWVPDMGYGFGFPLFNFYPPLPYLIGEIFRVFGFSFIETAKLTFALSLIVSGIAMYLLAKEFFGRIGGVLSSIFYIWAPYHAVDIYVRGAMNEAWALAWFPLIFWTSYKLISKKGRSVSLRGVKTTKQSQKQNLCMRLPRSLCSLAMTSRWVIVLTLSWFALFASHNLMVLIFAPFFAIWVLIHLWQKNAWRKIPQLAISGIWSLGLAAFFTFPALMENKFTQVKSQLVGYYDYSAHFVSIRQLLFSRFWGYGPSVWVEAEDGMSFQIGYLHWVLSLVVGGILLIMAIGMIRDFRKFKKDPLLLVTCYLLLVGWFAAFMTHLKSISIYQAIPQLGFIQFPWRFLTIVIFSFSFIVGYLPTLFHFRKGSFDFAPFTFLKKCFGASLRMTATIVLIILIVAVNWNYFRPEHGKMGPLTDEEKLSGAAWDLQQTAGIYDYLPKTAEKAPNSPQTVVSEIMEGKGGITDAEQGTYWAKFNVNVDSSEAKVRINIFDFPGWRVFNNNTEVEKYIPEEEEWGRMWITLPSGQHLIYTQLFNTSVRTVSNIVSLISFSLLIGCFFWRRRLS